MVARRVVLAALLVVSCGLLPNDDLQFRAYPLNGVAYDEAVPLVRDVARAFYTERFGAAGGFSFDWDPETGNLRASPIFAGNRRLRLYITLQPQGSDTAMEMFALVESLKDASLGYQEWVDPQVDVTLEQELYEAVLAERLRRTGR